VNPFMSKELAGEHIRDLREDVTRARQQPREYSLEQGDGSARVVTVRRFTERDIDGIRRLAALDEQPVPIGGVLVAELEGGELVAALPLDGGNALADPFTPTEDIVALLELRARQLREAGVARRSLLSLRKRLQAPVRKLA
jgi:hypothetical protein